MRLALEEFDANGGIQRDSTAISYGSDVVSIDFLLSEFESAAEVFQDILSLAPDNFCAHCWHLAVRIASVLVASGIDIGKGARIACPNDYSMEEMGDIRGLTGRSRHTKYNQLRATASRTFRDLLNLQKSSDQMGYRYHWALKSLLEWKEAIFLLAMRPHLERNKFRKIRKLHVAHTIAWANYECSEQALAVVWKLLPTRLVSKRTLISLVTKMIERDPNNIKYWLILASSFIPLQNATCMNTDSMEHWKAQYFCFPTKHLSRPEPWKVRKLQSSILSSIADNISGDGREHLPYSKLKNEVTLGTDHHNWLWPNESDDLDEEDHLDLIDDSGEMKTFDVELPGKTVARKKKISAHSFLTELKDELSVIVSKSIIAYHMYGRNDYTDCVVKFLVQRSIRTDKSESTLEYKTLLFIARMNVDICMTLQCILALPYALPVLTVNEARPELTVNEALPELTVNEELAMNEALPELTVNEALPELAMNVALPELTVNEALPELAMNEALPELTFKDNLPEETASVVHV